MEENYRETLSLGFGETVKIIEYAPSPVTKQITLNLITKNQKVEQKNVEILVKPVLRADKIEIVPENTTHFPIEDQENIKRNLKFSLFPLRFLFQNFVFSALFFNEKFKFQIRAIFSAVNSDECTASLHSHAIQAFLINENSFIRYLPSPDPSLSPSHANLSLPNHKLIIGGLSDSLRLINHQIKLCFDHSHHWSNFNIKLPRGNLFSLFSLPSLLPPFSPPFPSPSSFPLSFSFPFSLPSPSLLSSLPSPSLLPLFSLSSPSLLPPFSPPSLPPPFSLFLSLFSSPPSRSEERRV